MYMYLPDKMLPDSLEDMEFEEFFTLYAMAEIARELRIEDIEVGCNKGYVTAFCEGGDE